MTDYQRGDVVFTRNADGTRTVWLWVQPNGQAGEFVNTYNQMITAEGIALYEPRLVIRDNQLMPEET